MYSKQAKNPNTVLQLVPTQQLVHESETQRQFPRVKIPVQVNIGNAEYSVHNLSAGGMAICGLSRPPSPGAQIEITLTFPFDGFALNLTLQAEIRYHNGGKQRVTGLRFTNLEPVQISVLQHMIRSFLSGDVIRSEDILSVAGRDNFVRPRQQNNHSKERNTGRTLRQIAIYIPVTLAAGALILFVLTGLLERFTVLHIPDAFVSAPEIIVSAPETGTFQPSLPPGTRSVKQGRLIGTVTPPPQETLSGALRPATPLALHSPCDCLIADILVKGGEYRTAGDPVFRLIPEDSSVTVTASVPMEDVHRLSEGSKAVLQITGTRKKSRAVIQDIRTENGSTARVILAPDPDTPLRPQDSGRPVLVEFQL